MKPLLNTLFVTTQESYLAKDGECVAVYQGDALKGKVPIHTLGGLVLFGQVSCSPFLLGHCAENGVMVSWLTQNGRFLASMIYGDDVTHIVTEQGIAYLYLAQSLDERRAAIAAVAGATSLGLRSSPKKNAELRQKGLVAYPEDLGINRSEAKRSLLAAKNMKDIVDLSGGMYTPPARFRNW